MDRLIAERRFGAIQADGWQYPPTRKLRLRRTRRTTKATTEFRIDEDIADQPESGEDLTQRIDGLEREGTWLRATIKRSRPQARRLLRSAITGRRGHLRPRNRWQWNATGKPAVKIALMHCAGSASRNCTLISCNGGHLEKLMRQECSKLLWPEIERLAERR